MFQGHVRGVCCCNSDEQHYSPSHFNDDISMYLAVYISPEMSKMRQDKAQNLTSGFS